MSMAPKADRVHTGAMRSGNDSVRFLAES